MANVYYRHELDVEMIAMIARKAVEIQMQPQKTFMGEQASRVESLAQMNDRVAQYNAGIQALALVLINELSKEEETDGE